MRDKKEVGKGILIDKKEVRVGEGYIERQREGEGLVRVY